MDLAHLHLLLNHFPTIGVIIGGGLYIVALIAKSNDLKLASLVILLGMALIAIPTYVSGNGAQDAIKALPGVSKTLIETHEGTAFVGLGFMEVMGAFAWLALWQYRRLRRIPGWNLTVILFLVLVSLAIMIQASNLGGEIRHEEIRAVPVVAPPQFAVARSVGALMTGYQWMWATCETLHFIGLSLLLGVVFLVDLRVLGIIKGVSFASLHRLLPLAALGFGVNVITGMMFFAGIPTQYIHNTSFYWKLAMVMLAGLNAIYFTLLDEPWTLGPKDEARLTTKIAAASAMLLWVGVMYCGSMLPFLGNAF